MFKFLFGVAGRLLLVAIPAVLVGAAAGWIAGLFLLSLLLLAILIFNWLQLWRLRQWMSAPGPDNIPDAAGVWGDAFATAHRLNREHTRDRSRLEASLERFRSAASVFPDGVVILDRENRIEWFNEIAAAQFGFDVERDGGILITNLIRQPDLATYMAEAAPREALLVRGGPDGSARYSVVLIPFADDGRLLISRDVTKIEQIEAMRRDFVANVSHELRTPLTVVLGLAEHLVDDAELEVATRQRFLSMLQEQLTRMNRLVDDLLTLSRLESGTQPVIEEEVNVVALIEGLVEEGKALSGGRHRFDVDLAPMRLRANRAELTSAFGNLISNAVRYSPPGGQIAVRWRLDDTHPVFAVTDSGIGIAAEHIPRLTERFYRVDKGRSANTGGTGLGLAIVKHALQRHQASLEIASTVGEGSCFRAVFPARRAVPD